MSILTTTTIGTFRKENEKKRSKFNRDKFKYYMEELNQSMGFKKLSINKCLSTAVSILKLSKFSERFPLREQGSDLNEALLDTMGVSPNMFYDLGNYLGLAFDENGRVLHITRKLSEHSIPFNLCTIGSFLSQICFNCDEILTKCFVENSTHMEMKLKFIKKNKKPISMFFSGKVLLIPSTQTKMFIGYSCIPDKRDSARDPFMFNTGFELWIDSNYEVIKSNSWLELLVEDAVKQFKAKNEPINLLALLHPDDMYIIKEVAEQAKQCGFFKVSCRIFDGENYLWLNAKGFPQTDDNGQPYSECYVWPFAYEDFKTGDMYLLEVKKLWSLKQKRGKVHKSFADQIDKTKEKEIELPIKEPSPPPPGHYSSQELPISILGKRHLSSSASSFSSSSDSFSSPKRLAMTPPRTPSPTIELDAAPPIIRPIFHRSSAFAAHSGATPTFVPVSGNVPIMRVAPVMCKIVKVERATPSLKEDLYPVEAVTKCFVKDTECCPPDAECYSTEALVKCYSSDPKPNETLPQQEIRRLMDLRNVIQELKSSNPELYTKFAEIMENDAESASVVEFLPLILKLQSSANNIFS